MDVTTQNYLTTALGIGLIGVLAYLLRNYRGGLSKKSKSDGKMSFLLNLTALAEAGKIQTIVGMEDVANRMIHVLSRRHKSNPLLIGPPGVGKTAAVELLAQKIVSGGVPPNLTGVNLYALNLGELMAGTKYRGDLENRLEKLLENLESEANKNVLFIDEIQMIEQTRGVEGGLDLADIIKPALSRGELRVIGATTWREYETVLKPDSAIDRRFQPVLVNEPSPEETKKILLGVKKEYEKYHSVIIPDETVNAAVDYADKHVHDRHMPDKALDVIDEACAKVAIEKKALSKSLGAEGQSESQDTKKFTPTVTVADVADIVDQWVKFHKPRRPEDIA